MSIGSIQELHSCLKESKKSGNRIESKCIETLYPNINDYYTQLCNESADVEITPEILQCMKYVCKEKGFDPYYDHYYCYYINHDSDSECGLLAINVPESIKYRAIVAHNITQQHKILQNEFCIKMTLHLISGKMERLRTTECLILNRKDLYFKCVQLFKGNHTTSLDPEILYQIACDRNTDSDDQRWVRSKKKLLKLIMIFTQKIHVCMHQQERHILKYVN